jgi:hypothetical protein
MFIVGVALLDGVVDLLDGVVALLDGVVDLLDGVVALLDGVVALLDGHVDALVWAAVVRKCLAGPMWCQMQCVGAKFGHMAFYLPLLDGTVN